VAKPLGTSRVAHLGQDVVAGLNKGVIQPAVTGHLAGVATCKVIGLLEG
jgi:hypothetical protein